MIVSSLAKSRDFAVGLMRRPQQTIALVKQDRGVGAAVGLVGVSLKLRQRGVGTEGSDAAERASQRDDFLARRRRGRHVVLRKDGPVFPSVADRARAIAA